MSYLLLCPGPSLARLPSAVADDDDYLDGGIGAVNGAIHWPHATYNHWFLTDDAGPWLALAPPPQADGLVVVPRDWSYDALDPKIGWQRDAKEWFEQADRSELIIRWDRNAHRRAWITSPGWRKRTLLSAIVWLASNGHRRIDLAGCDMAGDGYYPEAMRYDWSAANLLTPAVDRWAKERHALTWLTHDLERIGVEVRRV